jgi:hypothetical protein
VTGLAIFRHHSASSISFSNSVRSEIANDAR